jgi:hypothetical protein
MRVTSFEGLQEVQKRCKVQLDLYTMRVYGHGRRFKSSRPDQPFSLPETRRTGLQ